MIDIVSYRQRIGSFNQNIKVNKSKVTDKPSSRETSTPIKKLIKLSLIIFILQTNLPKKDDKILYTKLQNATHLPLKKLGDSNQLELREIGKKSSVNFQARYVNGNQNKKKGVYNVHLNIRSLSNKISEVKCIIKEHSPHILGLSECELRKSSKEFDERKLKIPGYDLLYPSSWQVHGYARVVMYIKSSLHYTQVHDLQDCTVQSIWIKGGFKNCRKLYFCHAYREHTSTLGNSLSSQKQYLTSFLQQWESACLHSTVDEPNEVHIVGDMNLDSLDGRWLMSGYHLISLSRLVESVCNVCNITQMVSKPTRYQFNSITGRTDISCIDHIYTNAKFRCSDATVTPFGGSDHDLVSYVRYSKDPPNPSRTVRKRSYKKFIAQDFLDEIRQVDWSDVYSSRDLDIATELMTSKFKEVLNRHAPWTVYQQRKHYAPWLTKDTLTLMKERDDLKAKALNLVLEGKEASEVWKKFKKVRNKINNRRKYEETQFKSQKILESLDSPAATWKVAKSFMNWVNNSGPPSQLCISGKLVTKASLLATEMNNYFITKVRVIREGIQHSFNNFTECFEIMQSKNCSLNLKHVSIKKINKLLKALKNTKSTATDELDNFCVKLAADVIDKPLHHIITLSIIQRRFPAGWKFSKVIPLHKKQSKLEMKNYRPVTILSPLSKVLEKVIYVQIYEYFSKNKIFHPSLHGYRQHRSTQTALLSMYDRWVRAAAEGKVTGVILLDLSAAFDLVEPDILVKKLKIYGLDEDFLSWVESYMSDRYQAVWIDHVFSDFLRSDIGVPQGSNLGPLFFLIYFNDLPHKLSCNVDNYADDTTLSASGPSVNEIGEKLTDNCTAVSDWMRANMLKLNPEKTHILTVGTMERIRHLSENIRVSMDDVILQEDFSKCELLLGCYIESNLKWKAQFANLTLKLRKRLGGLVNLKYVAPFPVRKTIAQGLFNSILVYSLPLYGGSDIGHIRDIQVLQNKAARIVCHAPPRGSRNAMFDKLQWMTVNQLISYHTLLTVFKVRTSGQPEYLAKFLQDSSRSGRILRYNTDLSLAMKSFTYRGSALWNDLPYSVRNSEKIGNFKKMLRTWIFSKIPRFLD